MFLRFDFCTQLICQIIFFLRQHSSAYIWTYWGNTPFISMFLFLKELDYLFRSTSENTNNHNLLMIFSLLKPNSSFLLLLLPLLLPYYYFYHVSGNFQKLSEKL